MNSARKQLKAEAKQRLKAISDRFRQVTGVTKEKIPLEEFENIASEFPQYAYWLITGKTIPEQGHISP